MYLYRYNHPPSLTEAFEALIYYLLWLLLFQLTVDGFAIDKMAAEVKVRIKDFIYNRKQRMQISRHQGA